MKRALRLVVSGLLATAWVATAAPAQGAELEGVRFVERLRAQDSILVLNGVALLRYRIFFKVYVAGLYLGEGVTPKRTLEDVPRRLEIEYFYAFSAEDFRTSTREGIARNVGAEAAERLGPQIEALNALYRPVEPGDRYALTYMPGVGTELVLNGKPLGTVPGAEFSRAVFSIWFGNAPLDADLKNDLLTSG